MTTTKARINAFILAPGFLRQSRYHKKVSTLAAHPPTKPAISWAEFLDQPKCSASFRAIIPDASGGEPVKEHRIANTSQPRMTPLKHAPEHACLHTSIA
jgi:hypothetical protein